MKIMLLTALAAAALAACSPAAEDRLDDDTASIPQAADPAAGQAPPTTPAPLPSLVPEPPPSLVGEQLARRLAAAAENRATCAPLALRADHDVKATVRPATFAGGWGVAFDQPQVRSAYGFAGTGRLPTDDLDFAAKIDEVARQWPYVRRWTAAQNLPAGSVVGYGLEGARPYSEGSDGVGESSLAYLHIPGESCLYNVWSKLGRKHLEDLLGRLVVLK